MASPDRPLWLKAVELEYRNKKDNGVFKPTQACDFPTRAEILSTTWVMKTKANGLYQARVTARGFEQIDGEHFDAVDKAAPVVNDITIRLVLTLIVMAGFWAEIVDVKGAFLTAQFEPEYRMYIKVPKGFELFYPGNVVLLLKRTLYGTCQAAIQFWKKLCGMMRLIGAKQSKLDVCLFFQWTPTGILVCLSWVDDILLAGTKEAESKAKNDLNKHLGELQEYVGCKIERSMNERWMKLTQLVMIQSFMDEFDLPDATPFLPAIPGGVLTTEDGDPVGIKEAAIYRKGTGKVLHMMK
jgi:hypothetical protein